MKISGTIEKIKEEIRRNVLKQLTIDSEGGIFVNVDSSTPRWPTPEEITEFIVNDLGNDEISEYARDETRIDAFINRNVSYNGQEGWPFMWFLTFKEALKGIPNSGFNELVEKIYGLFNKNDVYNSAGEKMTAYAFKDSPNLWINISHHEAEILEGKNLETVLSDCIENFNYKVVEKNDEKIKQKIRSDIIENIGEYDYIVKNNSGGRPKFTDSLNEIASLVIDGLSEEDIYCYEQKHVSLNMLIERVLSWGYKEGIPFSAYEDEVIALQDTPNSGYDDLSKLSIKLLDENYVINSCGEINQYLLWEDLWDYISSEVSDVMAGFNIEKIFNEFIADVQYIIIPKEQIDIETVRREIYNKILALLENDSGYWVEVGFGKSYFVESEVVSDYIAYALADFETLKYQQGLTGLDEFINQYISFNGRDGHYRFLKFENLNDAIKLTPNSGYDTLIEMSKKFINDNKIYNQELIEDTFWEGLSECILDNPDDVLESKNLLGLLDSYIKQNYIVKPKNDNQNDIEITKVQNDLEKLMGNFYDEEAQKHPYNTVVGNPKFDELAKQRAFSKLDVSDFANEIYASIDANTDLNKFILQETILKQVATKNYDVSVKEVFNDLIDKGQSVMLDKLAEEVGNQKAVELAITTSELDKVKAYFGKFDYQKWLPCHSQS